MPTDQRYLKQTDWASVRNEFKEIAPDIFEAIEQIPLDDSFRLYEVAYPYGDLILNHGGIFHLPNPNGDLVPITDSSISKQIRDDLDYNSCHLPLGLICDGVVQGYFELEPNEINSPYFYKKGTILSGSTILDGAQYFHLQQYWTASSGCRTPALLASLANNKGYERLKSHYHLRAKKPDQQALQWHLFKELANSAEFKTPWVTKIIFFSKAFIPEKGCVHLKSLRHAQVERSFMHSRYERLIFTNNVVWNYFLANLRHKRIRDYHKQFARHVVDCALGQSLSYELYQLDNVAGPFNEIIEIILNEYRLPKNAPLLMIPTYYQMESHNESFISISMPSNNLKRSRGTKNDTILDDQRLIKFILNEFSKKILAKELRINNSLFEKLAQIHFDFYNTNHDRLNETISTEQMISSGYIKATFPDYPNNHNLCLTNEFIRACIKLSSSKTKK